MSDAQPLPLAPDRAAWAYRPRSDLGVHGECDLIYRVPVWLEAGPSLPSHQAQALPLLLHEFDRQPNLNKALENWGKISKGAGAQRHGYTPKAVLRRVLPRVLSYRYIEQDSQREFVFEGHRPSSLHVLGRVLESDFRFRLEDLSHFATHVELLLTVLHTVGLPDALDPEGTLYCPAVDSPFPFKFAVVGHRDQKNRDTYVQLLKALLRKTESDEEFRARNIRELQRGFEKFGPASATPQFQEVELRIWRLLTYLAARLRVKAGRLTDTRDKDEVRQFLSELRHVHDALDDLVHLPGQLAAYYRSRFDLELSGLYEQALTALNEIAKRVDCDLDDRDRSIDAVAALVSEVRRLGSASPLESLEEKDREIKLRYGDVEVPPVETGWARTYTAAIFTGAHRFDTRRYDKAALAEGGGLSDMLDEADLELDVSLDFGFGGGGGGGSGEDSDEEFDLGLDLDFGVEDE